MRLMSKAGALAIGLSLGVLWVGSPAEADSVVNAREQRQRERIAAGVEDGSLTRVEARRLAARQAKIERTERRLRNNDGQLGPRERK